MVVPGRRARVRRGRPRRARCARRRRRSACPDDGRFLGQYVFDPAPEWSYTTVVVEVAEPFGLTMNFESEAVAWVPVADVAGYGLHPGFAAAWPHVRPIAETAGRPVVVSTPRARRA